LNRGLGKGGPADTALTGSMPKPDGRLGKPSCGEVLSD